MPSNNATDCSFLTKKDIKLARKRNLPEDELQILNLIRTGTHSDLFKK